MAQCGHCGFDGALEHKGNVIAESDHQYIEGYGTLDWELRWELFRCPSCREPTLKSWWVSEATDFEFESPDSVYPTSRDNSALPENVRDRYDRALKVKKIDPGFYAVGIGRMLEAVCRDKGQARGDLNDRLDALATAGVIPEPLAKVAHQLRSLRNFGAHDADVNVIDADVPVIEDFAEAILEYLYRAPAKLRAIDASLKQRKDEGKARP